MIAGIAEFFAALAEKSPVVLWLDDLQWMDDSSPRLLQVLAAQLERLPILLVLTYRDEGIEMVSPIAARVHGARIDASPAPLSKTDVVTLLPAVFGRRVEEASDAAAIIAKAAEGNAFSVWEVCRGLVAEGAFSIGDDNEILWNHEIAKRVLARVTPAELLAGRIGRMSTRAQSALARAAIWGRVFTPNVVEATEESLGEAVEFGLIEQDGADYRFIHDRVLAGANEILTAEEKRQLHLKAGDRRASAGKEEYALAVAHYVEARAFDKAGRAALEAARVAKEMFAVETAVSFYLRALGWAREGAFPLSADEFAGLLYLVGGIALDAGKYAVGKALFAEWLACASAKSDATQRARAYRGQAFASFSLEDPLESIRLFRLALVELSEGLPEGTWECARVVLRSTAQLLIHSLRSLEQRARLEHADPRVTQAANAYHILWNSAAEIDTRWSVTSLVRGLAITRTLPPCRQVSILRSCSPILVTFIPPFLRTLLLQVGRDGLAMAEQLGDKYAQFVAYIGLGNGYLVTSDWAKAIAHYDKVTDADPRLVDPHLIGIADIAHMEIRIAQGDILDGIRVGRRALRFQDRLEDHAIVIPLRALTACCLGITGKLDGQADIVRECVDRTRRAKNTLQLVVALAVLADIHRRQGELGPALSSAREAVEIAQRSYIFKSIFGFAYGIYFETLADAAQADPAVFAAQRGSLVRHLGHALLLAAAFPGYRAHILWSLGRALSSVRVSAEKPRAVSALYRLAARIGEQTGARYVQARALRDAALAELRAGKRSSLYDALRAVTLLIECGARLEVDEILWTTHAAAPAWPTPATPSRTGTGSPSPPSSNA